MCIRDSLIALCKRRWPRKQYGHIMSLTTRTDMTRSVLTATGSNESVKKEINDDNMERHKRSNLGTKLAIPDRCEFSFCGMFR